MIRLLSWNCRGAGSPQTVRAIKGLLRDYHPNIMFLMETRVPSLRARQIIRGSSFTHLMAVEARGFSGGLWCFWDDTTLQVRLLSYTSQLINIRVSWLNEDPVIISLIYASPTAIGREPLYEYMEQMANYVHVPWLAIGDFNQVVRQQDKSGGRPVRGYGLLRMFRMIDECQLMEVEFSGPRFTWSNGQPGRFLIKQRIDQAWCNDLWQNRFGSTALQHLPRLQSDHHPLFLTITPQQHTIPKPFKFLACWMLHRDFQGFMNTAWQHQPGQLLTTIQNFTSKMIEWRNDVFGSLNTRRRRCMARLEGVQRELSNYPSTFLSQLEGNLMEELNDIMLQEEILWQQKNNLQWLLEGEQNTRFFHQTMANRQRNKYVNRLKSKNGAWVTSAEDIRNVLPDHYQGLFQAQPVHECDDDDLIINTFSTTDRSWINRNISPSEVEEAVFNMGAYKAPGPDGLPLIFFQRNWDQVGPAIIEFVMNAFRTCSFPPEANKTLITLIPKKSPPEEASHFRPIALINVIMKIITKIIANRFKAVIGKIISPTQCAFVPGRQPSDNIVIAQEIIHSMRLKRGRKGFMALKVDLEKAYDKVDWTFLRRILVKIGLIPNMVSLIMYIISSAQLSVIWDGISSQPFRPQRGIRQGDPLAPYLFLLCMEVLSGHINRAVMENKWIPFRTSRAGPKISHLFFADDLLLFGIGNDAQAATIEHILNHFCKISGQTISMKKSEAFISRNIAENFHSTAISRLGINITSDLGTYLGMPLINGRSSRKEYGYIVDKVRDRLAMWQTKFLSQAARLILIKSVLSTMPYYAMRTVRLPASIVDDMEKIIR